MQNLITQLVESKRDVPPSTGWRGFLIESKSFMSYQKMALQEKVRFWFRFPGAWLKFTIATTYDFLRKVYYATSARLRHL